MGGFFLNSILLGIGLAMDAFSVSVATGLAQPDMKKGRAFGIPGVFGVFQFLMPLLGWICVHTIAERFAVFHKLIPWIALVLLGYIGGKMLYESFKGKQENSVVGGFGSLMLLALATSIDALSTGFAIADYGLAKAIGCAAIVGIVTFVICIAGIFAGRKLGTALSGKAGIVGGIILIAIGLEIFAKGVFA